MLSNKLEKTIKRAISYATDRQHQYVTLEHLLLALIEDDDASAVLNACNVNVENLKISLIKFIIKSISKLLQKLLVLLLFKTNIRLDLFTN